MDPLPKTGGLYVLCSLHNSNVHAAARKCRSAQTRQPSISMTNLIPQAVISLSPFIAECSVRKKRKLMLTEHYRSLWQGYNRMPTAHPAISTRSVLATISIGTKLIESVLVAPALCPLSPKTCMESRSEKELQLPVQSVADRFDSVSKTSWCATYRRADAQQKV